MKKRLFLLLACLLLLVSLPEVSADGGTATVVFDLNDGRGLCLAETVAVTKGQAYGTLPSPGRKGYAFDGWYTSASSGMKITANSIVTLEGDHVLYAHWKTSSALTYSQVTAAVLDYYNTVTSNGTKSAYWNKGRGSSDMKSLTKSGDLLSTISRSSCGYEKNLANHHTGAGSKCNLFKGIGGVDGSGAYSETASDAQCSGFAAYMEYVIFRKTTIQGTGFTKYGGNKKLPSSVEIKPGDQVRYNNHSYLIYEVSGTTAKIIQCNVPNGSCKITLSTKKVADIRKLVFDGTKTFYISSPAVKDPVDLPTTPSVYGVTFDPQGGQVSSASKQVTVGQPYGTLPTPTRQSWVFAGWADAAANGKTVTATATVTRNKPHTLYAQWKVDTSRNGICLDGNTWRYYKNGVVDKTYEGFALGEGIGFFYVKNGEIDFTFTGIAYGEGIGHWYGKNGALDPTFTGVAYNRDFGLLYCENGYVNFTWNGTVTQDGKSYLVENSRAREMTVDPNKNGIYLDGSTWHYYRNGIINTAYEGFALGEGIGFFYVKNGQIDFSFTGIAYGEGIGYWYGKDGALNPYFTGVANSRDFGLLFCDQGYVNFAWNGTFTQDGVTYAIENSRAVPAA